MNDEIRFEDFKLALLALWERKLLILAVALLGLLVGIFLTLNDDSRNIYTAQSSVYGAIYGSYEESTDATSAMLSYADVLNTKKVCERAESILANSNISADDISRMFTSSYSSNSIILKINAYSTDPNVAVDVANAVAQAFVIEMRTLIGSDAIQMLDSADQYYLSNDGSKNIMKKRIMCCLGGFAASCAFFFVIELFSDKVKSIGQCVYDEDDKILAILPDEE